MAEPARKLMSATEFLTWDDGTEIRYELIDGVPVAMAPPSGDHNRIGLNACSIIEEALRDRRPCRAIPQGGLRLEDGPPGKVYIPDALMTCEPTDGRHLFEAPQLVVEVFSPSTQSFDKHTKIPVYASIQSIEEIWLVASRVRLVTVWQRLEAGWHSGLPLIGQASFPSHVLGTAVRLDDLYELTALATLEPDASEAPTGPPRNPGPA